MVHPWVHRPCAARVVGSRPVPFRRPATSASRPSGRLDGRAAAPTRGPEPAKEA